MASSSKAVHDLYHKAEARAKQQHLIERHIAPKSVLLTAPNNIIFELFNTVIKEVETDKLLDYLTNNLKLYLTKNWSNKITQQVVKRLKQEQAIDVLAGFREAPALKFVALSKISHLAQKKDKESKKIVDSSLISAPRSSTAEPQRSPQIDFKQTTRTESAVTQVYEHVMWRIRNDNVTQITSLLIKLVLDDGYKSEKLKSDTYDDVASCFSNWRSQKLIKLYAFGDAPANDQKLILASTVSGNLTKWIANYIDGSDKRKDSDLIRKLAAALRDKTKNCIYITNDIIDAFHSIESKAIRLALVVDRLERYQNLAQFLSNLNEKIQPLIVEGKLYVIGSLNCIEFAPDPTSEACC